MSQVEYARYLLARALASDLLAHRRALGAMAAEHLAIALRALPTNGYRR